MATMHRFFKSEFFNFEFLRLLSMAPNSGAEVAEALTTVGNIRDGDPDSWSEAFYATAIKTEMLADAAAEKGDKVAARSAYFRAANYYRVSQYMLHDRSGDADPRVMPRAEKVVTLFRKSVFMLDTMNVVELGIPYENGVEFPGYLYLPLEQDRLPDGVKTPVVINVNGGDSVQEELFFICPSAGPKLGYAVITFDGPGQGITLRKQGIGMRPDWETVIGKVIDWLTEFSQSPGGRKHNLDLDRIAVVGASMGGYFALRSAAEPRVQACVSIDPAYDMWDLATGKLPGWFTSGWLNGWISDSVVDRIVGLISALNFQLKWEVEHMKWVFHVDTASKALKGLRQYTLRTAKGGEFLENVQCAVMVTGAAGSLYFDPEQSTMKIFRALSSVDETRKEAWIADDPAAGGLQAKVGAFGVSNHKVFEFLDRSFAIERKPLDP